MKNVRPTSIETYKRIERDGLLSKRRFQVYQILVRHGQQTGGEVFTHMVKAFKDLPANSNTITRLGELRDLGVATEVGTRKCSVSGQEVILWQSTDSLPVKFEKPKKIKCAACKGKGHFIEQQQRMF